MVLGLMNLPCCMAWGSPRCSAGADSLLVTVMASTAVAREAAGDVVQADALHTTQAFFSGVWSRGRHPADRQIEPEAPLPPDRPPVRGQAQDPFHRNGFRETVRASHPLGAQGIGSTRAHQNELARQRLDCGTHHRHQNEEGTASGGLPPVHHQPAHHPRRIAATDPAALEH